MPAGGGGAGTAFFTLPRFEENETKPRSKQAFLSVAVLQFVCRTQPAQSCSAGSEPIKGKSGISRHCQYRDTNARVAAQCPENNHNFHLLRLFFIQQWFFVPVMKEMHQNKRAKILFFFFFFFMVIWLLSSPCLLASGFAEK